jgi:lysozyme
MEYSKTGLALTEQFEGLSLSAYQDVTGIWTIGYGHTIGVYPGQTITQAEAEALLTADIAWAVSIVNQMVTTPLSQPIFDSLVDFTYNLGSGNFQHSTLLTLVNQGNFEAAAEQFDLWDHASGGQVVAGLLRRRQAETDEFKSGIS